jgi:hypothetical protein
MDNDCSGIIQSCYSAMTHAERLEEGKVHEKAERLRDEDIQNLKEQVNDLTRYLVHVLSGNELTQEINTWKKNRDDKMNIEKNKIRDEINVLIRQKRDHEREIRMLDAKITEFELKYKGL